MTKNYFPVSKELSLGELEAIAAGKDGELFADAYESSAKQVGTMTPFERAAFCISEGIKYCLSFGRYEGTATVWPVSELVGKYSTDLTSRT